MSPCIETSHFHAITCHGLHISCVCLTEARTSWILPFTAGGFLHIALVTVLPDLLREENPKESLLHLASLLGGIGVMALLVVVSE